MKDVLRVVQLNIGSLLEPGWPERRHELVAWLDRLDPDVACFQEVWEDAEHPNTAAWIVERAATRYEWRFGGFAFPPVLWPDHSLRFGSAILSRWPIDQDELVALPVNQHEPADPYAALQFELLHVRTAGLDIFSSHLQPPPSHAYHRVEQVLFIDEAIKARRRSDADMPPILCADCNAEPMSDEIRFLTSLAVIDGRATYYQDAWAAAGNTEPGFTQDWRTNPVYAPMNLPLKRIDYVFVGDPFRRKAGRILSAELAFHEPITGTLASDHFGLCVDIRWPQRPT